MIRKLSLFLLAALLSTLGLAQVNPDPTKTGIVLPTSPITALPWTTLPAASSVASGTRYRASDIGAAPGIPVVSDATRWLPDGVQTLYRGAIPVGLGPSGTMGNNGAVTFGTALPAAYAACFVHFPGNAIVAGSAAGFYYVTMASTTVGTVWNNTYTSGVPTIPANPTAFATTGPGAFAGVITRQTLITLTLPGGLMGINGQTEMESLWSANNTVNAKTAFAVFGGNDLTLNSLASTSVDRDVRVIVNRASAAIQAAMAGSGTGGWAVAATALSYLAVNTVPDVTLKFDAQKATATDWMGLESFRVRVAP